MSTTPAVEPPVALLVRDEFLDLLCSDPEWLRAEFEEIVAAEWPTAPADPPLAARGAGQPPDSAGLRAGGVRHRLARRPRHPGIGGWARERSPP